jgi:hypothetical protein
MLRFVSRYKIVLVFDRKQRKVHFLYTSESSRNKAYWILWQTADPQRYALLELIRHSEGITEFQTLWCMDSARIEVKCWYITGKTVAISFLLGTHTIQVDYFELRSIQFLIYHVQRLQTYSCLPYVGTQYVQESTLRTKADSKPRAPRISK